jgi:hypothetical protein
MKRLTKFWGIIAIGAVIGMILISGVVFVSCGSTPPAIAMDGVIIRHESSSRDYQEGTGRYTDHTNPVTGDVIYREEITRTATQQGIDFYIDTNGSPQDYEDILFVSHDAMARYNLKDGDRVAYSKVEGSTGRILWGRLTSVNGVPVNQ